MIENSLKNRQIIIGTKLKKKHQKKDFPVWILTFEQKLEKNTFYFAN